MASGNVGDVPASSYAEYVPASSELHEHLSEEASDSSLNRASSPDARCDAPPADGPQCAINASPQCPAVRPALAHRLYSHRLHVRAKAKLHRDRLLSGPMINIFVGESKRHWALHRNLLCHHSDLLESELNGDGKHQQDKLELPDHDPAGFELLVKWLYQGKLDDVSDLADANQKYDYAVSCHKLYLLCERFDMPQLKNVAIDQYRKGLNEAELVPDADEINEIYRKSPASSPFRRLVTKIAARQIMDPESHRDVETYRECFVDNPDFAVDLVNAIKLGTGGMLFTDPTDLGNECEYHDHEAGPNCHIKGKGKNKQVVKKSAPPSITATARPRDPNSAKLAPSANFDLRRLPHRPPRLIPNPQPPARQARPQDGVSVGPLRRRLTSPASSTVEMTTENATATPLSPKEQRDIFRKVTPPERRLPDPVLEEDTPQAHEDRRQNSDGTSHQPQNSSEIEVTDKVSQSRSMSFGETSPRRGIWDWARVGTGRLNIIGRIPHPEWRGSKGINNITNGAVAEGSEESTQDDFSIPSTTSTELGNSEMAQEAAAAKMEGLGISNTTVDLTHFAQTKKSSDDLVAAASSINGTPSPRTSRTDETWTNSDNASPPASPSPTPRRKTIRTPGSEVSPSPHRIPTYKIALASNILSPARTAVS